MSRTLTRAIALSAGLAMSAASIGAPGGLQPVHPVVGNFEVVGDGGVGFGIVNVLLTVPGDNGGNGFQSGGLPVIDGTFQITFLNSMGVDVGLGPVNVLAAEVFERSGAGDPAVLQVGEVIQLDLSRLLALAPANAVAIDISVDDPAEGAGARDSLTINNDGFAGLGDDSDTLDKSYQINKARPRLDGAFVQIDPTPANSKMFLSFTFPNVGPLGDQEVNSLRFANSNYLALFPTSAPVAAANDSDTPQTTSVGVPPPGGVPGAEDATGDPVLLNSNDFEIDSDGTFPAPDQFVSLGSAGTLVDGQTFLSLTFDSSNATIGNPVGNFLRVDQGTGRVRDGSGQLVDGFVEIQTLDELQVESVAWINPVNPFDAGNQALQVTYNLPLDPGTLGNAAFYNNMISANNGMYTGINVTAVNPGSAPNIVLLTVNETTNADGVAPDGNLISAEGDATTGAFTMDFNGGVGVPPGILFDPSITFPATTQTVSIGDMIEPAIGMVAFTNFDADGNPTPNQTAACFLSDEPLAMTASTDGVMLMKNGGVTVNPFADIDPNTGMLMSSTTVAAADPADDEIAITSVELLDYDFDGDGQIDPIERNTLLCFNYDPTLVDWLGTGAGNGIPGTGDPGAVSLMYTAADGEIEDANGNAVTMDVNQASNFDAAPPVFFRAEFNTGDNQGPGSNTQFFFEQDALAAANVGDQVANNRAVLVGSENFAAGLNAGNVVEEAVSFGTEGNTFVNGDFLFSSMNQVTFSFNASTPTMNLAPGAEIRVAAGSGLLDASGNANELSGTSDLVDGVKIYVPHILDVNNVAKNGAVSFDTNDNQFVDLVALRTNFPVDSSTLANSDFSLGFGGQVTSVGVSASEPNVIEIGVGDSTISLANAFSVTYNGATDTDRIASDTAQGANGLATDATNSTGTAMQTSQPAFDTFNVAIMPLVGDIEGGLPGEKMRAATAVLRAAKVTAVHNNQEFSVTDNYSLQAWTNFLLGVHQYIYLQRDGANNQFYSNFKFNDAAGQALFGFGNIVLTDTIQVRANTNNVSNITFTGNGETTSDRLTNGKVTLCWDVLRSNNGSMQAFYSGAAGAVPGGYVIGGAPVLSTAVVQAGGRYEMHVSAPISAFDGRKNLDSINKPVILMHEDLEGNRTGLSSLLASINGEPLLFQSTNTVQESNGEARDAVEFNVDLSNVGTAMVFPGWNCVPFGRESGYATANNTLPVLPAGLSNDDLVIGSSLNPRPGPLNQWVWFVDANGDGKWTLADDGAAGNYSSLAVDRKCAFPNFAFTMNSRGIRVEDSIDSLVGGYGVALFNNSTATIGAFQFGPALEEESMFGTGNTAFPNNNTTQGWGLFTNTTDYDDPNDIFGNNDGLDYVIEFFNFGTGITVRSLDADGGDDNPNNLEDDSDLNGNDCIFGHYTR